MRVQRVLMPDSEAESWSVLGDDHVPGAPIERYLAYLAWGEKSPNTVKAYAHDLKDWFVYLAGRGLDWQSVTLEDVTGFVGWLRLPPQARDGKVAVLPTADHHCAESNTLLIQQVLADSKWADRLTDADRRGLSPLFWTHGNPTAGSSWT
ncbi:site-specific integrase [Streptomyces sp. NPDC056683]|uniref:site-specific integrase n=1 Tax=Streptomyces sp. NPDC056683 TaxID=3345910 RepID=UPI0036BD756D